MQGRGRAIDPKNARQAPDRSTGFDRSIARQLADTITTT